MPITRGFGGRLLSVVETTEGTTPDDPVFIKFSDFVQSVEVAFDPKFEDYRDIGSPDVAAFFDGLNEYSIKVTYLLHQDREEQLFDAINRLASDDLKSLTIEVAAGQNSSAPAYYRFMGAKADEVNVKMEVGKPVEVEISYMGMSATVAAVEPSVGLGSRESAALAAVCHFKTSAITRGGSAVAYVTRAVELSVSQNLEADGDEGSSDPKVLLPKGRDVTGTVTMSIDDGGLPLFNLVKNGDQADIQLNMGATGAPKLIVVQSRFENFEMELNTEDGFVKKGVPFRAESITTGTV